MYKMKNNKLIVFVCLIFVSMAFVSSFTYEEDSNGEPYYKSESKVVVPSIVVKDFLVLTPTDRPSVAVEGTIYFDKNSKKLKFFDGATWQTISFGETQVVTQVVEKPVETTTETTPQETVPETKVETVNQTDVVLAIVNESVTLDNGTVVQQETVKEVEVPVEVNVSVETTTAESTPVTCETVCSPVCETNNVCEDVETCADQCSTDEAGVETCEPVCEVNAVCEEVETCTDVCQEECGAPKELFDIRMDLVDTSIKNSSDLLATVTYQSFGSIPTPINLTFEVRDLQGNVLYSKKGNITVTVEEVRTYDFLDLVLSPGEYQFVFTTLYNRNVYDEFKQNFVVESPNVFVKLVNWFKGIFR